MASSLIPSTSSTKDLGLVRRSSQPQLPTELLDAIFDLCDPWSYPAIHLTSKRFAQIIRPFLFSRLYIHAQEKWRTVRHNHFEGFLHLASFVQCLEIISASDAPELSEEDARIQGGNFVEVLETLPNLASLIFDVQAFKHTRMGSSFGGLSTERVYDRARGKYLLPSILPSILAHPSLETLDIRSLPPDWITHPSLPLVRRPADRPLYIRNISVCPDHDDWRLDTPSLPSYGSNASSLPIFRSLVALGIHVVSLHVCFGIFSSDLLDLLQHPLQSLEILNILIDVDIVGTGDHVALGSLSFAGLVASHPALQVIVVKGIWCQDRRVRITMDLLWMFLACVPGFGSLARDAKDESWRTEQDVKELRLEFSRSEEDDRRQMITYMELDLRQRRDQRALTLEEVLIGIGKHAPELEALTLRGIYLRGKLGQLPRLPSGLFPKLQELILPPLPPPKLLFNPNFAFPSPSCRHHPHPPSNGSSVGERDQAVADALDFAGGPIELFKQTTLPRITSDVVRLGNAHPSLTTIYQDFDLPPHPSYGPIPTAKFAWWLERGRGTTNLVASLWDRSGVTLGIDDVGYCSCEREEGRYMEGAAAREWWEEDLKKTPLFELEPNFAPAFYLDDFFPKVLKPSRT